MVRNVQRSIVLQTFATGKKNRELSNSLKLATSEFNRLRDERDHCLTFMDFHRKVYKDTKARTNFHSNIVCDIERSVWRSKGLTRHITLKFNVTKDVAKPFTTKSMSFVEFAINPKNRIAIPIVKNHSWQRYDALLQNGWACKTYGLTSDLQIVAYLSKDDAPVPQRKNILGIDINAKHFAVSVLSPNGSVLYQTYFGKHIYAKRKKVMERRSRLQSLDVGKALKRLRVTESNFVETNLGQMVREIMSIAIRFDADIAIENLKRFIPKGRKFNKTVMKIPFYTFRQILTSRCFDNNVTLNIVDSWHTSKYCSHCGAVARSGHDSGNYALFRCKECGVVVNSDRNASKNIAMKSLLERRSHVPNQTDSFQISNRGGLVNDLVNSYEVGLPNVAVQHANHPMEYHAL